MYRFYNRKPSVSCERCRLGVKCFEILKPYNQNETGNGRRNGAKAKRIVRMAYAEIKPNLF